MQISSHSVSVVSSSTGNVTRKPSQYAATWAKLLAAVVAGGGVTSGDPPDDIATAMTDLLTMSAPEPELRLMCTPGRDAGRSLREEAPDQTNFITVAEDLISMQISSGDLSNFIAKYSRLINQTIFRQIQLVFLLDSKTNSKKVFYAWLGGGIHKKFCTRTVWHTNVGQGVLRCT